MKKYIAGIVSVTFGLAVIAQAEIIQFNLSPAGTDAAVGLSPLNEVPAATNSTGSGNEISAGISFDTDTSILTLALGYGSAAGFTNLTAPASSMQFTARRARAPTLRWLSVSPLITSRQGIRCGWPHLWPGSDSGRLR